MHKADITNELQKIKTILKSGNILEDLYKSEYLHGEFISFAIEALKSLSVTDHTDEIQDMNMYDLGNKKECEIVKEKTPKPHDEGNGKYYDMDETTFILKVLLRINYSKISGHELQQVMIRTLATGKQYNKILTLKVLSLVLKKQSIGVENNTKLIEVLTENISRIHSEILMIINAGVLENELKLELENKLNNKNVVTPNNKTVVNNKKNLNNSDVVKKINRNFQITENKSTRKPMDADFSLKCFALSEYVDFISFWLKINASSESAIEISKVFTPLFEKICREIIRLNKQTDTSREAGNDSTAKNKILKFSGNIIPNLLPPIIKMIDFVKTRIEYLEVPATVIEPLVFVLSHVPDEMTPFKIEMISLATRIILDKIPIFRFDIELILSRRLFVTTNNVEIKILLMNSMLEIVKKYQIYTISIFLNIFDLINEILAIVKAGLQHSTNHPSVILCFLSGISSVIPLLSNLANEYECIASINLIKGLICTMSDFIESVPEPWRSQNSDEIRKIVCGTYNLITTGLKYILILQKLPIVPCSITNLSFSEIERFGKLFLSVFINFVLIRERMDQVAEIFRLLSPEIFNFILKQSMKGIFDMTEAEPERMQIWRCFLNNEILKTTFALTTIFALNAFSQGIKNQNFLVSSYDIALRSLLSLPNENEHLIIPHIIRLLISFITKNTNEFSNYKIIHLLFAHLQANIDKFPAIQEQINRKTKNFLLLFRDLIAYDPTNELYIDLCLTIPANIETIIEEINLLLMPINLGLRGSTKLQTKTLAFVEKIFDNMREDCITNEDELCQVMKGLENLMRDRNFQIVAAKIIANLKTFLQKYIVRDSLNYITTTPKYLQGVLTTNNNQYFENSKRNTKITQKNKIIGSLNFNEILYRAIQNLSSGKPQTTAINTLINNNDRTRTMKNKIASVKIIIGFLCQTLGFSRRDEIGSYFKFINKDNKYNPNTNGTITDNFKNLSINPRLRKLVYEMIISLFNFLCDSPNFSDPKMDKRNRNSIERVTNEIKELLNCIYIGLGFFKILETFNSNTKPDGFNPLIDALANGLATTPFCEDLIATMYNSMLELCHSEEIIRKTELLEDILKSIVRTSFAANDNRGFKAILVLMKKTGLGREIVTRNQQQLLTAILFHAQNQKFINKQEIKELIISILKADKHQINRDIELLFIKSLSHHNADIREMSSFCLEFISKLRFVEVSEILTTNADFILEYTFKDIKLNRNYWNHIEHKDVYNHDQCMNENNHDQCMNEDNHDQCMNEDNHDQCMNEDNHDIKKSNMKYDHFKNHDNNFSENDDNEFDSILGDNDFDILTQRNKRSIIGRIQGIVFVLNQKPEIDFEQPLYEILRTCLDFVFQLNNYEKRNNHEEKDMECILMNEIITNCDLKAAIFKLFLSAITFIGSAEILKQMINVLCDELLLCNFETSGLVLRALKKSIIRNEDAAIDVLKFKFFSIISNFCGNTPDTTYLDTLFLILQVFENNNSILERILMSQKIDDSRQEKTAQPKKDLNNIHKRLKLNGVAFNCDRLMTNISNFLAFEEYRYTALEILALFPLPDNILPITVDLFIYFDNKTFHNEKLMSIFQSIAEKNTRKFILAFAEKIGALNILGFIKLLMTFNATKKYITENLAQIRTQILKCAKIDPNGSNIACSPLAIHNTILVLDHLNAITTDMVSLLISHYYNLRSGNGNYADIKFVIQRNIDKFERTHLEILFKTDPNFVAEDVLKINWNVVIKGHDIGNSNEKNELNNDNEIKNNSPEIKINDPEIKNNSPEIKNNDNKINELNIEDKGKKYKINSELVNNILKSVQTCGCSTKGYEKICTTIDLLIDEENCKIFLPHLIRIKHKSKKAITLLSSTYTEHQRNEDSREYSEILYQSLIEPVPLKDLLKIMPEYKQLILMGSKNSNLNGEEILPILRKELMYKSHLFIIYPLIIENIRSQMQKKDNDKHYDDNHKHDNHKHKHYDDNGKNNTDKNKHYGDNDKHYDDKNNTDRDKYNNTANKDLIITHDIAIELIDAIIRLFFTNNERHIKIGIDLLKILIENFKNNDPNIISTLKSLYGIYFSFCCRTSNTYFINQLKDIPIEMDLNYLSIATGRFSSESLISAYLFELENIKKNAEMNNNEHIQSDEDDSKARIRGTHDIINAKTDKNFKNSCNNDADNNINRSINNKFINNKSINNNSTYNKSINNNEYRARLSEKLYPFIKTSLSNNSNEKIYETFSLHQLFENIKHQFLKFQEFFCINLLFRRINQGIEQGEMVVEEINSIIVEHGVDNPGYNYNDNPTINAGRTGTDNSHYFFASLKLQTDLTIQDIVNYAKIFLANTPRFAIGNIHEVLKFLILTGNINEQLFKEFLKKDTGEFIENNLKIIMASRAISKERKAIILSGKYSKGISNYQRALDKIGGESKENLKHEMRTFKSKDVVLNITLNFLMDIDLGRLFFPSNKIKNTTKITTRLILNGLLSEEKYIRDDFFNYLNLQLPPDSYQKLETLLLLDWGDCRKDSVYVILRVLTDELKLEYIDDSKRYPDSRCPEFTEDDLNLNIMHEYLDNARSVEQKSKIHNYWPLVLDMLYNDLHFTKFIFIKILKLIFKNFSSDQSREIVILMKKINLFDDLRIEVAEFFEIDLFGLNDHGSGECKNVTIAIEAHDTFNADCYQSTILDRDFYYAKMKRKAKHPLTIKAIEYQQQNKLREAQLTYEQLMAYNEAPKRSREIARTMENAYFCDANDDSDIWENEWIECAKGLQQWDLLENIAVKKNDYGLLCESFFRQGMFIDENGSSVMNISICEDKSKINKGDDKTGGDDKTWRDDDKTGGDDKTKTKKDDADGKAGNKEDSRRSKNNNPFIKYVNRLKSLNPRNTGYSKKFYNTLINGSRDDDIFKESIAMYNRYAGISIIKKKENLLNLQMASEIVVIDDYRNYKRENPRRLNQFEETLPIHGDVELWSKFYAFRKNLLIFARKNENYRTKEKRMACKSAGGDKENKDTEVKLIDHSKTHIKTRIIDTLTYTNPTLVNAFAKTALTNNQPHLSLALLSEIMNLDSLTRENAYLKIRNGYQTLRQLKMTSQATETLNSKSIDLLGNNHRSHIFFFRAECCEDFGMVNEANKWFNNSIVADPSNGEAWYRWGCFLEKFNGGEAGKAKNRKNINFRNELKRNDKDESFKVNVNSEDFHDNIKDNLNENIKGDLNEDFKDDLNEDFKDDSNENIKGDSNEDFKDDSNEDFKDDLYEDFKDDLNENIKGDSNENIKGDLNENIKGDSNENIKGDLNENIKGDSNEDFKDDLYEDFKDENINDNSKTNNSLDNNSPLENIDILENIFMAFIQASIYLPPEKFHRSILKLLKYINNPRLNIIMNSYIDDLNSDRFIFYLPKILDLLQINSPSEVLLAKLAISYPEAVYLEMTNMVNRGDTGFAEVRERILRLIEKENFLKIIALKHLASSMVSQKTRSGEDLAANKISGCIDFALKVYSRRIQKEDVEAKIKEMRKGVLEMMRINKYHDGIVNLFANDFLREENNLHELIGCLFKWKKYFELKNERRCEFSKEIEKFYNHSELECLTVFNQLNVIKRNYSEIAKINSIIPNDPSLPLKTLSVIATDGVKYSFVFRNRGNDRLLHLAHFIDAHRDDKIGFLIGTPFSKEFSVFNFEKSISMDEIIEIGNECLQLSEFIFEGNNYEVYRGNYEDDGGNYKNENNYEDDGDNYEDDGGNYKDDINNYEDDENNYKDDKAKMKDIKYKNNELQIPGLSLTQSSMIFYLKSLYKFGGNNEEIEIDVNLDIQMIKDLEKVFCTEIGKAEYVKDDDTAISVVADGSEMMDNCNNNDDKDCNEIGTCKNFVIKNLNFKIDKFLLKFIFDLVVDNISPDILKKYFSLCYNDVFSYLSFIKKSTSNFILQSRFLYFVNVFNRRISNYLFSIEKGTFDQLEIEEGSYDIPMRLSYNVQNLYGLHLDGLGFRVDYEFQEFVRGLYGDIRAVYRVGDEERLKDASVYRKSMDPHNLAYMDVFWFPWF